MNKSKQNLFFKLLFTVFFILNSCTEKFESGSIPTPVNNNVVRGPAGVGSGGGVIIVENNGNALAETKYEIYLQENGFKEKIQNGTTDKEGKVFLSESVLSSDKTRKLLNGSAKLIVEVYQGNVKTVVGGRVIVQADNGNNTVIDIGNG